MTAVPIRNGHNVWRLVVSDQLGLTRKQVLQRTGSLMKLFLAPAQPSGAALWTWPRGQTAYAWGCGAARPMQAWDATDGSSQEKPGMPIGDVLAVRTATDVLAGGAFVKGEPPAWWVEAEFWWRAQDTELPSWPVATDWLGRKWATLDAAVQPRHEQPMPDLSRGEARSDRWEDWWDTTLETLPEAGDLPLDAVSGSRLGRAALIGAGLLLGTYILGQYLGGRR